MSRSASWILVVASLAVTAGIYWSGLYGSYVYDDYSFIVGNEALKIVDSSLGHWLAAAMSFPSGAQQGRWLGMLSFAVNHYFTGLDPFAFKLTNLAIHLANGVLLFLALRELFALRELAAKSDSSKRFDRKLAAATLAALWLVLPINLTAVLYVSQRLEAFSNTFVFLGLWWYLHARVRYWLNERRVAQLWASLIVCTGIGVTIKESAVLLPLYAALVEVVLTRGRIHDGRRSKPVLALYASLLAVPLVVGLVWLATWVDGTRTYGRAFDIPSRLLTEARVLIDYMRWTLAPSLDALTLYHDDIEVSTGVLSPATTLASIVAIALLLASALWQRAKRPLYALGIFWFFGGHLLTATVIPLMLAFEHRNYFPSVGLLLAAASLLALEPGVLRRRVVVLASISVFGFYALTTALRAQEWSNPDRLTLSEASKRPRSPSAQFERGHLMITKLRRPDGTPMTEDGYLVLEDNMHLPGAGTTFEQSLITFHAERHQPVDPAWWDSLIAKLKARPPSVSDARVLANLNHCFIDGYCGSDLAPLKAAYAAALDHQRTPPTVLSVHAEYAWYLLHDEALAERDIREATRMVPFDANARRNLAVLLLATGKLDEAGKELEELRRINFFGMLDSIVNPLSKALEEKRAETAKR